MNKLYTLQGTMRQGGLKQAIAVIATSEADAIQKVSTFADNVVFERVSELGLDWNSVKNTVAKS